MAQNDYQQLAEKIDRLSEQIASQFTRIEDVKLSKSEYLHAHEAIVQRVNALELKMDTEGKAADSEHLRIETASSTRYDKIEAKFETLNTKVDGLKDSVNTQVVNLKEAMNTRFDNLRDTQAASRRSWVQWGIPLIVTFFSGGGLGGILIWYLAHLPHP